MSSEITQDDVNFYIPGYPTGYPWIDYLSDIPNVFFPKGAMTEVMGLKSTAKSTLIFEAIAKYHRDGGQKKTLYLDFERTVKKQAPYLASLGVDIANKEKFVYRQPATLQEGGQFMLDLLRGNVKGNNNRYEKQQDYAFIVVDTVAAMRPEQEVNNALGETKQTGLKAKLMTELLRNMTSDLDDDGPAIVFVNQVYEELNINGPARPMFMGKSYDSSSSNALKYYCSFRITLTLKTKIKGKVYNPFTFEEDEQLVGSIIEAMAEKSKIGVPSRKVKFVVKYGFGIDPIPTLMQAAIKKPVQDPPIKVESKTMYQYRLPDGTYSKKFRGVAQFEKFLHENIDIVREIACQTSPEWGECFKGFDKSQLSQIQGEAENSTSDL